MPVNPAFHNFLRFTWSRSPFYRSLYAGHGIHESDLDEIALKDLPVINKLTLRENFDQMLTDPRLSSAALDDWLENDNDPHARFLGEFLVIASSASSKTRVKMVFGKTDYRNMSFGAAAYLYPGKITSGSRYRNAFFASDRGHAASTTTAMASSRATFEFLITAIKDPIEETIARLNSFQPDRLTGYCSSLGWLAELALAGKLSIFPQDVVGSSDRMTPAIEGLIRQAWNPNIYDLYAATESLYIAVKQPGQSEWKVLEDLQTIEVLDENDQQVKTGEIGRAVLTNWNSRILPLIRYDLTDYVVCGETRPGRSSLRGFAGRSFDNLPIRLDDGGIGKIPSHALVSFGIPESVSYQFVSHSPDDVEFEYCTPQDMDEVLRPLVTGLLRTWGGMRTNFHTRRVDHIWNHAESYKITLVRKPEDPLLGFPQNILSASPSLDSRQQLRPGGGFVPMGRALLDDSLVSVFEGQVARTPEAIAVKDGLQSMTYARLNRAANQVARALLESRMDPAFPVALLLNHQVAMITAMLGVLKAGGWYAPLDPTHPPRRNIAILQELGAGLVLTDGGSLSAAQTYGFSSHQIINLDDFDGTLEISNPELPGSPEFPVCILYTSGSTGKPRGIVLDQRAVLHRVLLYTNDYAIGPADHLALLQSYVFNASVREIYASLLNGAGLYIYSVKKNGVHRFASWLQEEGISVLYMVPSVFRMFLDTLHGDRFERLRLIRLGGEPVLAGDVAGFQQHFRAGCLLSNAYAATETGTISQYFIDQHTPIVGKTASVGFAVHDKNVSLLDEDGCPVENGVTAEIVVTSSYMGPGNYPLLGPDTNNGLLSQRSIRTGDLGYRLPDGRIVLVGRKDWQIKLRGQRINLLEIEQTLNSLENVEEAVVTLQVSETGDSLLLALVQRGAGADPGEDTLRRSLRDLLPEAMIPSIFLFVDHFQRTAGGKVDRSALPSLPPNFVSERFAAARQGQTPPETPVQETLAGIWRDVLGLENIGINDDFFDLGGHSLLAARLVAQIQEQFGQSLPLGALLENNTIQKLAALISANSSSQNKFLVTIRPQGNKQPIFLLPGGRGDVLYYRNLAKYVEIDRPLYGLQAPLADSRNSYGMELEALVSKYLTEILELQPEGPYYLAGHSFGGYIALEMAHQLLAQGRQVAFLGLWDTYPPGPNRQANLRDRILIHRMNLRGLNSRQVLGYFRDRWISLLARLAYLAPVRSYLKWINYRTNNGRVSSRISRYGFHPDPYPGDLFLFSVKHRPWYVRWDPMVNWHKYIKGELIIREVQGEHGSMLFEPYVQDLAHQLNDCLRMVEAGTVANPISLP
jgi:amino acid adenylation domain-containing protein